MGAYRMAGSRALEAIKLRLVLNQWQILGVAGRLQGVASAREARTESSARLARPGAAPAAASISLADRQLVKDSFGRLMASQQFAMEYLYARLFVQHPQ